MKFDSAAADNPIDRLKVVGQAIDRIDGPLKTTGSALYAYEHHAVAANQAYGFVVGSAIARGRVKSIDDRDARRASGVLAVVTAANAGNPGRGLFLRSKPLVGPDIQHYHQAIALVVAETFEQARAAAGLLRIDYDRVDGKFSLAEAKESGPLKISGKDSLIGDFDGAFAAAKVTVDQTYTTPDESHAMIEPHASLAYWEGEKLHLWTSLQLLSWGTRDLARTLGMAAGDIHIRSHYIGGGFGAKCSTGSDAVLAVLGARATGRPVKVALTRALLFNNTGHRAATIQRVAIGADADGRITAIAHEGWAGNLAEGWAEPTVLQTRVLYAGANRKTALRLAVLDLPEGSTMRAPGEASGLMALEIAMDEMAEKLGIDPIAFRIRNDTQIHPEKPGVRFSIRQLTRCFSLGADRFGWEKRTAAPGTVRDGHWLVGIGTASAIRTADRANSAARVRLSADGTVTVETDMTDIGTGSYTIIAQTAAEMMGLPIEKIAVRLGDSTFPVSGGSVGQHGANSSTSGVYAACVKLREAVAQKLALMGDDIHFTDGHVRAGDRKFPLAAAARDAELVAEDGIEFVSREGQNETSTFGAHFAEVGVDIYTGEIRVRRMLAICAAGRILNPKTARSQVIGAMTMAVGAALSEKLVVDERFGYFVNHDLAHYEVPVHADIPHLDAIFLDETDPDSSPMKAKGVGELGICGAAAAIANAVYNATGVRTRDYPIRLDKLIDHLPAVI